MDIFFSSTANYINNIQQANAPQVTQPSKTTPERGAPTESAGTRTHQKDRRAGGVDSLGKGNVL